MVTTRASTQYAVARRFLSHQTLARMPRLLLAALFFASAAAAQSPAVGNWSGELTGTGLTLILHVTDTDGALAATFDVPMQGATGVPVGTTSLAGDRLTLGIPSIGGRYEGTVAGDAITGTWSQGGASLPLVLTRLAAGDSGGLAARADTPRAPFPYRDEDVTIASVTGVTLAGTLTLPAGAGPFPAVVLVTGSGPQDRDEALLGHRPFAVLADALARRGSAVLRTDDRGVGRSTGDFRSSTTADFALDAQAAAEWLAARPEVSSVGVVGHSEGGEIAPMAANASTDVDFVVLLAGPAISGREVLRYQLARGLPESGASAAGIAAYDAALSAALDAVASGDAATAAERARAAFREGTSTMSAADRATLGPDAFAIEPILGGLDEPWMRYFIAHDPAPALRSLRVPAFAVFGALDQQVRASDNVPAMRAALADAPAGTEVRVFPGLNHLFQPTATGDPTEYGQITTSFSAGMMAAVADWILAR